MSYLRFPIIFFFAVFFLLVSHSAYAVSTVITDFPDVIGSDPFSLSVAVAGASPGTNYLRIDLYEDGTTDYFGETFTGNEWYNGSEGIRYFPITVGDDKTWSGTVQARIGNTIAKSYDGTGLYKVRVRRYTGGGNYNNDEAKASAVPIALLFPTATPQPTNTPTPAPTDKPASPTSLTQTGTTRTAQAPTTIKNTMYPNIRSVTPTKIFTNTIPTGVPKKTLAPAKNSTYSAVAILGIGTKSAEKKPTSMPAKSVLVKGTTNSFPRIVAISIGGLLLVGCGVMVYLRKVKGTR